MNWNILSDILILLFISIFIILPLPFLILFVPEVTVWSIIPFLWGISAGYIIQKGITSGFIKRGLIIGIIIFIFIFVYSYYLNEFLLNLVNIFTQNLEKIISENRTIPFGSMLMKLEVPSLHMSIISSITVFIGILLYSFIISKLKKK